MTTKFFLVRIWLIFKLYVCVIWRHVVIISNKNEASNNGESLALSIWFSEKTSTHFYRGMKLFCKKQ